MKKILSFLLAALVAVTFVPTPMTAFAQDVGMLSLSAQEGALGASVTLALSLDQNPGLCTLSLEIQYDAQVLELVDVKAQDLIGKPEPRENGSSPYPLTWIDFDREEDNTKTGTLCFLTFRILPTAPTLEKTTVFVTCTDAYNTNYQPVSVTGTQAEISVFPVLCGDLNEDNAVTNADAIYLLYRATFGEEQYPTNQPCDFDRDGDLTCDDALYLAYHTVFGQELYPL